MTALTKSQQTQLIASLQEGLSICQEPFQDLAKQMQVSEESILQQLEIWKQDGSIRRFGVIVRHHELGYRTNAMVVWNIPDNEVEIFGQKIIQFEFVTLCYQRNRSLPEWPYNLYAMIHGKNRESVLLQVAKLSSNLGLSPYSSQILFSLKRFKQRGARYVFDKEEKVV